MRRKRTAVEGRLGATTRHEADATLAEILRDEPDFEGELWVETIEFEYSLN
jgi:hypothetical protein